jgi:molybdopterin-guanine dinucleotide biosynthesis protein A
MDVDAYILIGGRSSRFGTDKAFVEFEGETLAGRAARIVEIALAPVRLTFVAASNTQFSPELSNSLDRPLIADVRQGFGAWSGIHAALNDASSEWTFIFACDLPFVSVEFLKLLAGLPAEDHEAVVPRQNDGHLQPLCAYYSTQRALAVVEELLTDEDPLPPVNAMFYKLSTYVVEPQQYGHVAAADKLFLNINSQVDLMAAASAAIK